MRTLRHALPLLPVPALALALLLALSLPARPAAAGSQSLITLGMGTEFGVNRHSPIEGGTARAFVSELTLRLRVVKVLGLSFAYNVVPAKDTGELVFTSTYRLSALLYVVPTRHLSLYLSGGYGAQRIGDLITVTGPTNTYHAGAGLEVYIGDHVALHVEYLWLIPGAASIEGSVTRRATEDVQASVDEHTASGTVPTTLELPDISAGDYLRPGNFQLNFGFRWYL